MKFNVKNVHRNWMESNLPSVMDFPNEAIEDDVEFISQEVVHSALRPFVKDPVGTYLVFTSPNTNGTPINAIELFTYNGYLLVTLERVE